MTCTFTDLQELLDGKSWGCKIPMGDRDKDSLVEAILQALFAAPSATATTSQAGATDVQAGSPTAALRVDRDNFLIQAKSRVAIRKSVLMEVKFMEFLRLHKWHESQGLSESALDECIQAVQNRAFMKVE